MTQVAVRGTSNKVTNRGKGITKVLKGAIKVRATTKGRTKETTRDKVRVKGTIKVRNRTKVDSHRQTIKGKVKVQRTTKTLRILRVITQVKTK